jgi:hypothetical protein
MRKQEKVFFMMNLNLKCLKFYSRARCAAEREERMGKAHRESLAHRLSSLFVSQREKFNFHRSLSRCSIAIAAYIFILEKFAFEIIEKQSAGEGGKKGKDRK